MRQFEKMVANYLTDNGYEWGFEVQKFKSRAKVKGNSCLECGAPMFKLEVYTPDFCCKKMEYNDVTNAPEPVEFIVEVKGGSITPSSRARICRFHKQHGEHINYVMVFRNNVRVKGVKGNPKATVWGERNGIKVVIGINGLEEYLND